MRKALTVTIPEELLREVDRVVQEREKTRSYVVTAALGYAFGYSEDDLPKQKGGRKPKIAQKEQ